MRRNPHTHRRSPRHFDRTALLTTLGVAAVPYYQQIIDDFGPIAYWQQAEGAGLVAVDLINSPAQNGAYTGITWPVVPNLTPNGNPSPFFDGINDFNDIFTAAFDAAFNGVEGGIVILCQVFNVGVWADGIARAAITIWDDANNNLLLRKAAIANNLLAAYESGAVAKSQVIVYNQTTWFTMGLSWSAAANEFRAYLNGVQQGLTQGALGVWGGLGLLFDRVNIGCFDNAPLSQVWHGYLADTPVFDYAPTPVQMAEIDALLRAV